MYNKLNVHDKFDQKLGFLILREDMRIHKSIPHHQLVTAQYPYRIHLDYQRHKKLRNLK